MTVPSQGVEFAIRCLLIRDSVAELFDESIYDDNESLIAERRKDMRAGMLKRGWLKQAIGAEAED